jgi:predicted TIM-barrel fold metal-dependent hydrolase
MIIDAHIHLPVVKKGFNFEKAKNKLLSDMKKNKVDYAIIIPDNIHGSAIGDLDVSLKLIKNERRLFLLGTIDIRKEGKEWIKKLDLLFKKRKIKGIKIFPGHDPIYPTDKRLIPVYKLCIKYDYPIVIHTGWNSNHSEAAKYNNPKYIIKIAKKFPKLKIIIAHYFWPEVEYCYKITRGFKNIYFDTSGLADDEVIKETGLDKIKKVLEQSIRDNSESVLFGTDYAMCDIKKHIKLINSLKISKEDREKVFWKNAHKLFKLKMREYH